MKYKLEFEVEDLPKTFNEIGRKHWAVKAREAKKWTNIVSLQTSCHRPESALRSARLRLTRFSARCPDPDGLAHSFKHVVDGLVRSEIISNDTFTNIGMPEYRWEKAPPKKGKIKVEVWEE